MSKVPTSLPRSVERTTAARLRDVSDAALSVASELDLEQVLQKVVDTARTLIGARYAALGVIQPGPVRRLDRFVTSGMDAAQAQGIHGWPQGRGLLGALLDEPRPLRLRRMSDDPRSVGLPAGHPPMTSLLGLPIRAGDRVLGNFYLTDKIGADEFDAQDEDLLALFAAHAAAALDNARRFTETGLRLEQTLAEVRAAEARAQLLLELSAQLPAGHERGELPLAPIAAQLAGLLGDGCALLLLDPRDGSALARQVVVGALPDRQGALEELVDALRAELLLGVGQRGETWLFRETDPPVGASSAGASVGALPPERLRQGGFSAALAVPLGTEQRRYGVLLALASRPRTLGEGDLAFAALVAQRLALALENARLVQELRAALSARDELISIATHELKTPLATMKAYAQLLLARSTERDPREHKALQAIARQADQLASLANELLDVARLQADRLELHPAPLELAAFVGEVLDRFAVQLEAGSRHRLRLVEPATGSVLRGHWEAARLEQVLLNLLANAVKYSPGGGEILVEVERLQEQARVGISDPGIGIPAAQQQRIFEPFQRASNATGLRIEGVGLGLHISREIIERHGGRMGFESEEGKGSRFWFLLPLG